jgi:hypothetical protein
VTPAAGKAGSAASVRARLQALARGEKVEFQLLLSEFAVERFLYRLGVSPHGDRYVLKGAMLFRLWSEERGRATWDLDMLGRGAHEVADVVAVIRDLCRVLADDGIVFDTDSIEAEEIRVADEYAGVRVRLLARLAGARIPMQIDVGFGDAVTPAAVRKHYPTLLEHAPPHILVYPREAVIAEKLEAMMSLGVTNSRMKDFYDVHSLSCSFSFDGAVLADAIRATFERRGTPVPSELPLAITRTFLGAPERQTQWRAFLRRGRLDAAPDASELADALTTFLGPPIRALANGERFAASWTPYRGWQRENKHLRRE